MTIYQPDLVSDVLRSDPYVNKARPRHEGLLEHLGVGLRGDMGNHGLGHGLGSGSPRMITSLEGTIHAHRAIALTEAERGTDYYSRGGIIVFIWRSAYCFRGLMEA